MLNSGYGFSKVSFVSSFANFMKPTLRTLDNFNGDECPRTVCYFWNPQGAKQYLPLPSLSLPCCFPSPLPSSSPMAVIYNSIASAKISHFLSPPQKCNIKVISTESTGHRRTQRGVGLIVRWTNCRTTSSWLSRDVEHSNAHPTPSLRLAVS